MFYTDIDRVKIQSGLENNTFITDPLIHSKIVFAQSIIDGVISDIYQMPIPYFWNNTIVFSGTGSGSGTMTITINGIDYVVAITNLMTAEQVADKFREVSVESDDFEVESTEDDTTVRILAKTSNDKDSILITSTNPQTVVGITATMGTPATQAHGLLREIATEIASGALLNIAYGKESENTDKEGYQRMNSAIGILNQIRDKKIKLFDGDGTEFTTVATNRISFFPNRASNTGNLDDADTSNRFGVNQEF